MNDNSISLRIISSLGGGIGIVIVSIIDWIREGSLEWLRLNLLTRISREAIQSYYNRIHNTMFNKVTT